MYTVTASNVALSYHNFTIKLRFLSLPRYIYTDTADLKGSTVLKCLNAGKKYCIDGFVQACSTYLETSISVENVLTIYEQACLFDMPDLQERCMRFIADYAEQVLKSEELLTISNKTLVTLLDRDDLNAEEKSAFEAAVKWAKLQLTKTGKDESQDNIRQCLGDAFYSIRLPIMPIEDFAEAVSPSHLLSEKEEVELYRHIATASKTGSNTASVGKYKVVKRKPRLAEVFLKQNTSSEMGYFSTITQHMYMQINASSSIKLHSVSGSMFNHGVNELYTGTSKLDEEKWRLEGNTLLFHEGLQITAGAQTQLSYILANNKTVKEISMASDDFNILGGKVDIEYGVYSEDRLESMVFIL